MYAATSSSGTGTKESLQNDAAILRGGTFFRCQLQLTPVLKLPSQRT